MVVLPGEQGNVGDAYGRGNEKPLAVVAAPESRETSAAPEQLQTQMAISGDRSGQITDEATLSATLTSDGVGVAGKEIVFTLDGQEVGRADTDGNGQASVPVTLTPPAREATQSATFAGDAGYTGSTASDGFAVNRDDSNTALSASTKGSTTTAVATLTDVDSGSGLAGRTIHFFLNGTEVGSAVTDASGKASSTFKAKKGAVVRAVFDGDDSYLGSSS
jgi:hypothetical protein